MPVKPRRGSKAYCEGVAEYRKTGEPSSPCPADCKYERGDNERASWFLGWVEARTADCLPSEKVSPACEGEEQELDG